MTRPTVFIFALLVGLTACSPSSPPLEPGVWTGTLTPMNHPDLHQPVTYDVQSSNGALSIALVGPGGQAVPTRSVQLDPDTLFFTFDEPEEQVPLDCALVRDADELAGRCTDASGKWARFTMRPPKSR